ncbi:MAG TPA: CRISPR-associated protein Cas4 [Bacillales bacterium]|nr:CRISPR-associated protein Cas4 [Bacillales bacterium]
MDEYIMISAIQHYSYCPRQCALIHREQVFTENTFTLKGRYAHERVDIQHEQTENDVRQVTSLNVWSDKLGITGICDLVEFYDDVPFPVEYKFGRKQKAQIHDELQLCAQAMCLEEMLGVSVPEGSIFHYSSRTRRTVIFSDQHRKKVQSIISNIRKLSMQEKIPPAVNDARCENCSLIDACMPDLTNARKVYDWTMHLFGEETEVSE